jgi:hypothetical protein
MIFPVIRHSVGIQRERKFTVETVEVFEYCRLRFRVGEALLFRSMFTGLRRGTEAPRPSLHRLGRLACAASRWRLRFL